MTITVPQGQERGEYAPKVEITVSSVKKITVVANVTIKSLTDVALTQPTANVKIDAGVDSPDKASALEVEVGDVSTLFSNYVAVNKKVTTAGGSITFTVKDASATLDNNNKLTIDKSAYKTPITVTATVKCGEAKDATYTATVYADPKLSGTWTVPTKFTQNIAADKNATAKMATGFVWADYRGKDMWKDGSAITGDDKNGFATSAKPLEIYALSAPSFEVTGDNADKFSIAADGTLSYSTTGKNMATREGLTVTVKVTAKSQWGGTISSEGNVTEIPVIVK